MKPKLSHNFKLAITSSIELATNKMRQIIAVVFCVVIRETWIGCTATADGSSTSSGSYQQYVHSECSLTTYPNLCLSTLSAAPRTEGILSALVDKTIAETEVPIFSSSMFPRHDHAPSLDYCSELMSMSVRRLNQTLTAVKTSPTRYKNDVQTWLSAALTFQQTCKDDLSKGGTAKSLSSSDLVNHMTEKMDYLSQLVSNPLSLINRMAETKSSASRKMRSGNVFPTWVSGGDRKLLESTGGGGVSANAVVAKDGSGKYTTISAAINAAYGNRYVIYVKKGVYNEKIHTNKDGITLIGDGKYATIISGSSSAGHGSTTSGSATFTITGDRFIAMDIGFQNSAGPNAGQAVAITVASDHAVFFRCSFSGYQDTLYALALRQFYRDCDIYGTIDFIFGNAAAVFQNCNIMLRKPRSGGYNAILANGRSDPGQNTGFSVQKCKISASSELSGNSVDSYLGRPWRMYSRAVIMQSSIDGIISSRGWHEWEGASSSTYKNLYFAEYANVGSGASTSGRVQWGGHRVISASEASKFTVANFIVGTSWLPSTGVTFISGL